MTTGANNGDEGGVPSTLSDSVDPTALEGSGPEGPERPKPQERWRKRHVISVGGGRGGVGKTLLATNLAVYLAQLGRNVVLVDADPFGSNPHSALGLVSPPMALPKDMQEGRAQPVLTTVPGLTLLPTAYDVLTVAPRRTSRKSHWLAPLDRLEGVDYVVLNLGASVAPASLDAFHEADVSLCVASPEPPAIEATYRFCRALFARRLKRTLMREQFRMRVVERALQALPHLPTPRQIVAEIARYDESLANVAATALYAMRPGLVIGKARLRRDYELGPAMASLAERYLGVALDYLGYIEQDDAVWITARRRRPLLIDAPTSKAARNLERVARRILALMAQPARKRERATMEATKLNAPLTLYKVLGVDRSATDDEIRRAFKLQREIFKEDSLPLASLVDHDTLRQEQARIAEAHDTLLDPARRRAYDLSVFPGDDAYDVATSERRLGADEALLAQLQADLAREITPETEFNGPLLKKAREAQGVEIRDIATITKISAMHLRAIESEDVDALPALVYVRGFLQQIARALSLDPSQVTRTYLKRVRGVRPDYE